MKFYVIYPKNHETTGPRIKDNRNFNNHILLNINLHMDKLKKSIIILTILFVGCTDQKGAEKALRQAGYHPIEVGGYSWFDGSEDDVFKTKFKAYSPDSSEIVQGTVCKGWFKGNTIRLD